MIADGGSTAQLKRDIYDYIKDVPNYRLSLMKGRCIDTRRKVIDALVFNGLWRKNNFDTDIIAWIDSDEVAYSNWLQLLVEPIEKEEADFVGGKVIPSYYKTKASAILSNIERVRGKDPAYIAMGNSAWSTKIFREIGNFDDSSISSHADSDTVRGSYHISDDYDINLRALQAGFKGTVVDAYTFHNQSHINTYRKMITYFYGQFVRTAMAYFKHRQSVGKFTKASKKIHHPFQLFLLLLKGVALVHGWKEWMTLQKTIDTK